MTAASMSRRWEVYQRRDSYRVRGSRRGEAVTIGRTGYLSFSADALAVACLAFRSVNKRAEVMRQKLAELREAVEALRDGSDSDG